MRLVAIALLNGNEIIPGQKAGISGVRASPPSLSQLYTANHRRLRDEMLLFAKDYGWLLRELRQRPEKDQPVRAVDFARSPNAVVLISRGFSNKEIARELGISISTVKNHVHSVLEKLRVQSRSQAVARISGRDFRLEAS